MCCKGEEVKFIEDHRDGASASDKDDESRVYCAISRSSSITPHHTASGCFSVMRRFYFSQDAPPLSNLSPIYRQTWVNPQFERGEI